MSNFPTGITSGLKLETTVGLIPGVAVVVNAIGKLELADRTNLLHAKKPIGITTTFGYQGKYVAVCFIGKLYNKNWNWDTSLPIFLGLGGMLTQVVPTTGFIKILGIPCTSNLIWINPETSIILV